MADTESLNVDREEILSEEERVEKKGKWMYPIVIAALIVIFIVIFGYGLRLVTTMEHPYPPVVLEEGRTPVPQNDAELADYLNAVVEKALAERPKLSSDRNVRIDGDSVETDGGEYVKRTLDLLVDSVEDTLDDDFEATDTEFGDPLDGVLPKPALTADDIESFSVDYAHFYCVVCGAVSDEQTETCENCGTDYRPQERYSDDYSFTVTLKNDPGLLERLFGPDAEQSAAFLGEHIADLATIDRFAYDCDSLTIFFKTNRKSDELKEIKYAKVLNVNADVSFTGEYRDLAPIECSCAVGDTTEYYLTFPAVILNKHEVSVEPKKRDELVANRVQTDPECKVTWTSSDENVVTVDDEGFLKAGKQPGEATITASMEFGGKTYSDSCKVNVKVSVQYLRVNKHKLRLNAGESETLKARVSADQKGFSFERPTVTTVTWYTTDESVATVDENGTVTALAPGTATVYALSDDGYYKSSCDVTVS